MPKQPPLSATSLAVAALDISRVLADRDGITFRAQGTCMYPTVRPGDVLRVRSCSASEVAVGDIAVCRAPDYLFSHRVIATGACDGRACIVTRPDRSRGGGDTPTFDDDLLGVVIAISRKGSAVPLQPMDYPRLLRIFHGLHLALIQDAPRWRFRLTGLVGCLQSRRPYRSLAHRWFRHAHPRLRFMVRTPAAPMLGEAVYREIEVGDFNPGAAWHGRPIERWTITAHVDATRNPAALITFIRGGHQSWRAAESYVRVRYRGTGLDDALLRQAERILGRSSDAAES